MSEIVPAIIGKNFKEVIDKVLQVEGLVNWVQIDVTDGLFAPDHTWENSEDLAVIPGKIKIEVHLMTEAPEETLKAWMQVADRVIVHYESTEHLAEIIGAFSGSPVKFGLALLLDTPIEKLESYRGKFNLVQLMSIAEIGHHGEPLDEAVVEKIKSLRAAFPDVTISVDGGVNLKNAPRLVAAGADNLVVGSAIWNSGDVAGAISEFQKLLRQSV